MGRDDHASADFRDGSFLVFGGYVNGSRVDEVLKLKQEGASLNIEQIAGGELTTAGPAARAGFSVGVSADKQVYLFGGQEDDNRKLNDIWNFNTATAAWTQIELGAEDYKP